LTACPAFVDPLPIVPSSAAPVPRILQIYREPVKPEGVAVYDEIEKDIARTAAALGCPNPYLGAESLTGPKVVWWFNGFESAERQKQVYDAYTQNAPLMAALQQSSARKAELTLAPVEVFAHYRQDLSIPDTWVLGRGRLIVVRVDRSGGGEWGTVFEASDGTLWTFMSAQTLEQAESVGPAGSEIHILAVRPEWSFAAAEWIAMDPELWGRACEQAR
jgi:hypothetical protein